MPICTPTVLLLTAVNLVARYFVGNDPSQANTFFDSVKTTQEQGTSMGPRRRNPPKKNPPGTGHTSDRLGCLAIFLRQRVKNF
jgi:hypothetical protein